MSLTSALSFTDKYSSESMLEETSQMVIFGAGVLLVLGGVLGLAPLLHWRRAKEGQETARSFEKVLVRRATMPPAAPLPPVRHFSEEPTGDTAESPSDDAPAEEALAEAENTPSLSSSLAAPGNAEGDEALVEELFAELFSIRTALASLTAEVKSLHGSIDDSRAEKSAQPAA